MRNRIISIILIILTLLTFSGCAGEESVLFYYLRSEFVYGTEDGVIAPEQRKIDMDDHDLSYLLKLYLEGPLNSTFTSPFPKGSCLLSVQQTDSNLTVVLSEEFAALEELDLTLAAGCLASTCFTLTQAAQIQITSGDTVITLTRDSLTLLDDRATAVSETTG